MKEVTIYLLLNEWSLYGFGERGRNPLDPGPSGFLLELSQFYSPAFTHLASITLSI